MQHEKWWRSLVSTALLGTDRQSPEEPKGESPLCSVLQQLDWKNSEVALLKSAGIFSVYQLAGKQRNQSIDPSEAVPLAKPDVRPSCSSRIAAHLKVGIEQYPQTVKELLLLIADAGRRVSPPLLPAVLRYGEKYADAHATIAAVLDSRGQWLAQQNPNWQYISVLSDADDRAVGCSRLRSLWQTGTKKQRMLALRQWRRLDPDEARDVIAQTWKSEDWRTRESILSLFHSGLSMADEPFLEAALDDRSAGVRRSAAECLARLPESRLCQRMAKRVQDCIHLDQKSGWFNGEIAFPEGFDIDWKRDGLKKATESGPGSREGWIEQMISKSPLAIWPFKLGTVQQIVRTHPSGSMFLYGWAQAIYYQRDTQLSQVWAAMLLHQLDFRCLDQTTLSQLLSVVSAEQRERYLKEQLSIAERDRELDDQDLSYWLQLVADCTQPWDYDFSQRVLAQLTKVMNSRKGYEEVSSPPASLALFLHPGLAPTFQQTVEQWRQNHRPSKAWRQFVDEFLDVLVYRWQMYQLFVESG